MIWVNFKIYQQTFGSGAIKLAKICRQVEEKTKTKIIPLVSPLDLRQVKEKVGGQVWLQNLDLFFEGKHTGWLSPLGAILAGAEGAILNHSEHEIPPGKINQILSQIKKKKWLDYWQKKLGLRDWPKQAKDFSIMVCFKTRGQIKWLKKLRPKPDFFAYEPPELIGGRISVAQAKPEIIKKVVKAFSDYRVIVGAGVREKSDVISSLKLGARGVLVSSDIVKAKDPEKELTELALAFKNG